MVFFLKMLYKPLKEEHKKISASKEENLIEFPFVKIEFLTNCLISKIFFGEKVHKNEFRKT